MFLALAGFAHAEEELVQDTNAQQPTSTYDTGENEVMRLRRQVSELERRIADLDRSIRYQNDRIRDLERTVNDLRRLRP